MKTPPNVKWIKAEKGDGLSIIYSDKEGSKMTRRKDPSHGSLKGSKAWRHNNPGNLVIGTHSRQHGAIGYASYIVIGEDGKPDTKEVIAYRNFLKTATKLEMNRTIQSLSLDEFNTLIKKMENYEGWHPWEEGEDYVPIQKVIGVKMHKHHITNFLVRDHRGENWIPREHAIKLAESRMLRAVVVHHSKQVYLRPFPKETPFKEMIC